MLDVTSNNYGLMTYKGRIQFVTTHKSCGMGWMRTASFSLWTLEPITTTDLYREREYGNDNFVLVELRDSRQQLPFSVSLRSLFR